MKLCMGLFIASAAYRLQQRLFETYRTLRVILLYTVF